MSLQLKQAKVSIRFNGMTATRTGMTSTGFTRVQGGEQQFLGGLIKKIGGGLVGLGRGLGIIPSAPPPIQFPSPPTFQEDPRFQERFPVTRKPGARGAIERFLPGGKTGFEVAVPTNGRACPKGFHPNKTSYFLKDGTFVPKGAKCVKNRRRNPLNPRAASRAISRLESAKKAVERLQRIQIKCKRCGLVRCKC